MIIMVLLLIEEFNLLNLPPNTNKMLITVVTILPNYPNPIIYLINNHISQNNMSQPRNLQYLDP